MKRLRKAKEWIRKKGESVENAISADLSQISICREPERYLIQSEVESANDRIWAHAIGELLEECKENGIQSPYPIGYRQNLIDIQNGIFDNYRVFYEMLDYKPAKQQYHVRPEGNYLVAFHKGDWRKIEDTYRKILEFVEEEKVELESYFYEDYLLDSFAVKNEEDYVTKIVCRVKESR